MLFSSFEATRTNGLEKSKSSARACVSVSVCVFCLLHRNTKYDTKHEASIIMKLHCDRELSEAFHFFLIFSLVGQFHLSQRQNESARMK